MLHVYAHTRTKINATFDSKVHFAYLFLGFRINNNLHQIHTIFTNCSILLLCVNKSVCLGMKVIFPIVPFNDLVITILNSKTLDNYYWKFRTSITCYRWHNTYKWCRFCGIASASYYEDIPDYHFERQILHIRFLIILFLFPSNCLLIPIIQIMVVSPTGMKIYLTSITSYIFDFCQKHVSELTIAVVSRLKLAVGTCTRGNIRVFICLNVLVFHLCLHWGGNSCYKL